MSGQRALRRSIRCSGFCADISCNVLIALPCPALCLLAVFQAQISAG